MDEKELRENFATNLLRLRKDKNWNQQELAEKLSYSDKAISKWENGDTIPDVFTMKCIASLFNITIDQLISKENVVKESNKTKNRLLVTLISSGLCFLIATVVFFGLKLGNIKMAYMSYLFALAFASIVLIVFTKLWFKRIWTILSADLLVLTAMMIVMIFMGFHFAWIVAIAAVLIIVLLDVLLHIIN
ncbi:MAG: helix-turn-helix transcriptional regulator [Erysipelotrichales bacterium]|nr:helix-turn-helix transcriptional regulator [Erysipelotrichales bacterium]